MKYWFILVERPGEPRLVFLSEENEGDDRVGKILAKYNGREWNFEAGTDAWQLGEKEVISWIPLPPQLTYTP
jgi:hypothetical protein